MLKYQGRHHPMGAEGVFRLKEQRENNRLGAGRGGGMLQWHMGILRFLQPLVTMVTDNIRAGSNSGLGLQAASQKPLSPAFGSLLVTLCEEWCTPQSLVLGPAQVHSGTERHHAHTVCAEHRRGRPPSKYKSHEEGPRCVMGGHMGALMQPPSRKPFIQDDREDATVCQKKVDWKYDRECQHSSSTSMSLCAPVGPGTLSLTSQGATNDSDGVTIDMDTPVPNIWIAQTRDHPAFSGFIQWGLFWGLFGFSGFFVIVVVVACLFWS